MGGRDSGSGCGGPPKWCIIQPAAGLKQDIFAEAKLLYGEKRGDYR